ncbi:hypothetical protein D9M73_166560 [compost metagenome]
MAQQRDETIQRGGLAGQVQPQQVRQLTDGNHHGSAKGEAEYHRVRDEIHQCAKSQQTQQPLKDAGQEGEQQDHGDVVLRRRNGQRTDAGVQDNRDGRCRTADQMPRRTPEAGDQHRDDCGVQAVFRWETSDERVGNGLWQRQNRAAEADDQVTTDAGASLPR